MHLEIRHGDPVLDGLGVDADRLKALFGPDYVLVIPPFYHFLAVRERVCKAVDVVLGEAKDDELIRFRHQVELRLRIKAALFYLSEPEKAELKALAKPTSKGLELQLTDFHGYPIGEILGELLRSFPDQVHEIKALFAAELKAHTGIIFAFRKSPSKKAKPVPAVEEPVEEPVQELVTDAPPVEEALSVAEAPQVSPRVPQDELIKQHMAWVKGLAKAETKSCPHDFEDVYAAGLLGLVEAAACFKTRPSKNFQKFALRFIEKRKRRLRLSPKDLLEEPSSSEIEMYFDSEIAEMIEIRSMVPMLIEGLSEQARYILWEMLLYGVTASQLAVRLKHNEGRIYAIKNAALMQIREALSSGFSSRLRASDFAILDMLFLES